MKEIRQRMDNLAIIIPAYNEAGRIASTIAGIRKVSECGYYCC